MREPLRLDEFWEYIQERYDIRRRRLAGEPWPWTTDPILRDYSFTNVKREWDRTTQWLLKNWYNRNWGSGSVAVNCCLARQIGRLETLRFLGFQEEFVSDRIIGKLRQWRDKGQPVYTNAYMITAIGMMTRECVDKIEYTVRHVVGPLVHYELEWIGHDVEETVGRLIKFHGWAGFMAQEAALDMALTGVVVPSPNWAHAGPGAKRGLNWIFGEDPKAAIPQKEALRLMRFLRDDQKGKLAGGLELTVHDIQFCLCEFGKLCRARHLGQMPKNRYHRKEDR